MVFEASVSYSDYSHKVLAHCMCPSYYIKSMADYLIVSSF